MAADRPRALWYDSERDRTTCGFSERPEDTPCGALVTAHGLVDGTYVALYACARHEPYLIRNSDWHHVATPTCRDPRAVFTWDDLIGLSFCYVPDEPSSADAAEHAATGALTFVPVGPPAPTERNTQP